MPLPIRRDVSALDRAARPITEISMSHSHFDADHVFAHHAPAAEKEAHADAIRSAGKHFAEAEGHERGSRERLPRKSRPPPSGRALRCELLLLREPK